MITSTSCCNRVFGQYGELSEEFKEVLVEAFSKTLQSSSPEADHVWKNKVVQELWKEVSSCRADLEMPLDLLDVFDEITLNNNLIDLLPNMKHNREVHGDENPGLTSFEDDYDVEDPDAFPEGFSANLRKVFAL